jgi:CheY-like chemotaxis protein
VLDGVYDTTGEVAVFHPVRAPTAEQLQALLNQIIKRAMKLLTRLGYLVEEQDMVFMAETDTGERRDRRRERPHTEVLACRSLLNRSSPASRSRSVFRFPRNGLISHPQLHSIRFRSRAENPVWSTAVFHPKIRPDQRRSARLRVQKAPFSHRLFTRLTTLGTFLNYEKGRLFRLSSRVSSKTANLTNRARRSEESMRPTILHIEDEPILATLVQSAFKILGFQGTILNARSVSDGMTVLENHKQRSVPLDLILVDMLLPDGSGLDVIRKVKSNPAWSKIPVVALSGESDPRTVTEAYALGANCYLSKAPDGKTIIDAVEALYRCWMDVAMLPSSNGIGKANEFLDRAVYLRTRSSDFYTKMARRFSDDADALRFWLGLALNEGNLANLLAFFRGQLNDSEIPAESAERFRAVQSERETNLNAVDQWLESASDPSVDDAYWWALRLESSFDVQAYAQAFGLLFKKAPEATRLLKERFASHIAALSEQISAQAEDEGLRAVAEELKDRKMRLQTLTDHIEEYE